MTSTSLKDVTRHPDRDRENPDELEGAARGEAWARHLERKLQARAPRIQRLRAYRRGDHPLELATDEWRETFGEDFAPVDNWCALVVEAPVERMTVLGFRFGQVDDSGAPVERDPDREAWHIWQENLLDLESELAHDDAITTGYSAVLVWPDEDNKPLITVEDPLHTIVEYDPANRRRRIAAMKRWRDLAGAWRAQVWTADRTWTLTRERDGWRATDDSANPLRRVPVVELVNNPDIWGEGHSDCEPVISLQDAVNKLFADLLVASEFASYHQRVLIGAEIPTDEHGEPLQDLRGGLARWIAIEVDAEPGDGRPLEPRIVELRASDLSNYISAIQEIVLHIAAQTKTPPTYILGQLVNVSGDAIKAAEAALVKRVRRKMRVFGEAWEEALRLAFLVQGDEERGHDLHAETIWDDPETISESQRVDALVKLRDIGVPEEALWEMVPGHSPRRHDRWAAMRDRQAIVEGLTLGSAPGGAAVEPLPPAHDAPAVA